MNDRPSKWDLHFLRTARLVREMSKDPSSKIGAVLVKDRRVIATGYNGFPRGIADDERLHDRAVKYELVVHAEMNCLLQAGQDARDATMYLYGYRGAPCRNCAKHLIQAGVSLYVATGEPTPDRWQDDLAAAEDTLREAGVGIRFVDLEAL